MANQPAKYRKFVVGAASVALVASAVAPVASAATKDFSDIKGNTHEEAIKALVEVGAITGYEDGTFKPNKTLTRSDVVKMLGKWLVNTQGYKVPVDYNTNPRFADQTTKTNDELLKYSAVVKDNKIFNGYEDGTLGATGEITRENMALVLVRAYDAIHGTDLVEFVEGKEFKKDVVDLNSAKAEARPYIDVLDYFDITNPASPKFNPKAITTRGHFASFLYKTSQVNIEPAVKDEITSVKAINDTRVEVTFGTAIDKDLIREAEKNGKYFAVYTEGNAVQSNNTVQSTAINFSADGKTATFDLTSDDALESGKKYYVALLKGDNNKVADVLYTYGPTVLKAAADAPSFEVSAVADKIFVKYSAKMKDSAKEVGNYEVYDEGGKKLGALKDFLKKDSNGEWVNLNNKDEVEFVLDKDSTQKLLAGKKYKLVVKDVVKTDDNKTLAESDRTITISTPSVDSASPVASVARITGSKTIEVVFDQDISGTPNLNPAQLNLQTSTGKTVDTAGAKAEVSTTKANTLVITLGSAGDFDKGLTYKMDMPANVVQNGIFTNAMNKATAGLVAKAQENVSISTMSAKIVADPKNAAKADLVLTFDQVPLLDGTFNQNIKLYDGRDGYTLDSSAKVKTYGQDTTGKSVIIEDVSNFKMGGDPLNVQANTTYDVEIAKETLKTDSFDSQKAVNKAKLKASTAGITVSAPVVDKVLLQSANKVEIQFEEDITGNLKASDVELSAFVANRSDIFNDALSTKVSGTGFFDVAISGKTLTITAKSGVKFPTAISNTDIKIAKNTFTNATGKVGNSEITVKNSGGTVSTKAVTDNATPVIVSAKALASDKEVQLTFSEAITQQGSNDEIATLFFTNNGENASEGVKFNPSSDKATVTFKDSFWKSSTDLSKVTVEYKQGNNFYLQDVKSNKVETQTIKGLFTNVTAPTQPDAPATTAERAELKTAVNAATTKADKASAADYTDDALAKYETAIAKALAVHNDAKATKADVDAAKKDLDAATKVFDAAKKPEAGADVKLSELAADAYKIVDDTALADVYTVRITLDKLPESLKGGAAYTLTIGSTVLDFKPGITNPNFNTVQVPVTVAPTEADVKNAIIKKK